MNCILIDDEPDCLELLAIMLGKHCPGLTIIGQYDQPQEGIDAIWEKRPDLVFLDVDMPGINGFGVLDACRKVPFQVIFTTAHQEHALKAFKYSATGYLLKPVDRNELAEAVEKATLMRAVQTIEQQREVLFDYLNHKGKDKIAVGSGDGVHFLTVADIEYCKASGNYTMVYFSENGKEKLFTRPLGDFEALLDTGDFFRPHNSFIVHLKKVKLYVKGDGGELIMNSGDRVTVSRGRKEELLKRLGIG